jgi:hypothetical protein
MSLRDLPEKELRREWHAARMKAADLKRELERRKTVKKHAREQSTRTRAPG